MILEEETFKQFGYYPKDLKPKSNKKIVVKCDSCGEERKSSKNGYHDLCHSCAMMSNKTKKKMSEAAKKRFEIPENNPNWKGDISLLSNYCADCGKEISRHAKRCLKCAKKGVNNTTLGKHWKITDTSNMKGKIPWNKDLTKETNMILKEISNDRLSIKFSIETREKMCKNHSDQSLNKNSNWRGGISFEPYCVLFNDEFKERVRKFFNRQCFECSKSEKENNQRLSVHHVTYNKDTCCDDSLPLFVPLCRACHNITNSNREYWEKYFTKRLMKEYNGKCYISKEENHNDDISSRIHKEIF